MSTTDSQPAPRPIDSRDALPRPNPYIVFALPLAVYLLGGAFESSTPAPPDAAWWNVGALLPGRLWREDGPHVAGDSVRLRGYPAWRRPGWSSLLIGLLGVPLWIGLAELQAGMGINDWFGEGKRVGFDPWNAESLGTDLKMWVFLMFRFTGLVVVIPIAEEMFLRGFVMRYPQDERWWAVPWGQLDRTSLIIGTLLPMGMHPHEALAALVWFGMIHWVYTRTKNVWDCVVAHAVTNLGLAIAIVRFELWRLW
ncbi:MAG: CAAX prenyl protease-related protein [Pirellulales bacterium]